MCALQKDHLSSAQALVAAGADLYALDGEGRAVLYYAVDAGNKDEIEWLLDAGLDINHRDYDGSTVLRQAITHRKIDLINLLLDLGAYVNNRDVRGHTQLIWAVFGGSADAVRVLLDRGADVMATSDGYTALSWAHVQGYSAIVTMLAEHIARRPAPTSSRKPDYSYLETGVL
jgi:ankyrin repeat protein